MGTGEGIGSENSGKNDLLDKLIEKLESRCPAEWIKISGKRLYNYDYRKWEGYKIQKDKYAIRIEKLYPIERIVKDVFRLVITQNRKTLSAFESGYQDPIRKLYLGIDNSCRAYKKQMEEINKLGLNQKTKEVLTDVLELLDDSKSESKTEQ